MKEFIKASIRPIFIGFLFYLFILLGHNTELVSNDLSRTWSAIIAGTLFLYLIAHAAVNKKEDLGFGALGYYLTHILFSIGTPIFLIANHVFFKDHSQKTPSSLLEKNKIVLISKPAECNRIKYGTFLSGNDTIIRFSENDKDFELIKIIGLEEKLNRIKWLDSCSYVKIINEGSVTDFIKVGNIEKDKHQMFEKPVTSHTIEDEILKTLIQLKN